MAYHRFRNFQNILVQLYHHDISHLARACQGLEASTTRLAGLGLTCWRAYQREGRHSSLLCACREWRPMLCYRVTVQGAEECCTLRQLIDHKIHELDNFLAFAFILRWLKSKEGKCTDKLSVFLNTVLEKKLLSYFSVKQRDNTKDHNVTTAIHHTVYIYNTKKLHNT